MYAVEQLQLPLPRQGTLQIMGMGHAARKFELAHSSRGQLALAITHYSANPVCAGRQATGSR